MNRGRNLRFDVWQKIPYRVGHFDGVGSCSSKHSHNHRGGRRWMSSHPETHIDALVLHTVFSSRNVSQIDWSTAVLSDNELLVLIGGAQLPLRLKQKSMVRPIELPG